MKSWLTKTWITFDNEIYKGSQYVVFVWEKERKKGLLNSLY